MTICRKFYVSGKVQGVFFRDSTRQQAASLNITGHAINLSDGRVEVLACGDAQALDALDRWLQEGPSRAEVSDVERREATVSPRPDGFSIG